MAYSRTFGETRLDVIENPACIHLRSKAVYVTGELEPQHLDEIDSHEHNCWCNLNQHVIGPDEAPVLRRSCVPGRQCYVARG